MKNRPTICLLTILAAAVLALTGCGAAGADFGAAYDEEAPNGYGGPGGEPSQDVTAAADYGQPPPAEEELNLDLKAPQASEHYVYIAATERDSLVRIAADESLDIRLIPVGGRPTTVATLPEGDVALVINSGTQDLSIVRSQPDSDAVKTVDTLPHVNTIAVSPDGNHAVVYYNDQRAEPGDLVGDFQTVNVVSVAEGSETVATVSTGFHPTAVYFHESQPVAWLVTDDGVAVLDLDAAQDGDITPIVPLSLDPLEDPELREVLITPDGSYAVVRNLALAEVRVVDLATQVLMTVPLDGLPTDVDLVPGSDTALLVLREQALAYLLDLDAAVNGRADSLVPIDIAGSQAGAAVVSRDGARAVLYSTVGSTRAVTVLALDEPELTWQSYPVQKAVEGVAMSLEGTTALVLHDLESFPAEASSLEKTIASNHGFTLFDLDSGYRKLVQTKHRWTDHLFVAEPDGTDLKAFILTPDPAQVEHSAQMVELDTFIVTTLPVLAQPLSMVYVPVSRKVAVAQDHPNGRITFIDVDSGQTYSVTGYELNGLIH